MCSSEHSPERPGPEEAGLVEPSSVLLPQVKCTWGPVTTFVLCFIPG